MALGMNGWLAGWLALKRIDVSGLEFSFTMSHLDRFGLSGFFMWPGVPLVRVHVFTTFLCFRLRLLVVAETTFCLPRWDG